MRPLRHSPRCFFTPAICASLVVTGHLLAAACNGEDWPMWRGALHDGVSVSAGPTTWSGASPEENVRWKQAIPGVGHASPVVTGHRVFVVTCLPDEETRLLLCLDRVTGRELWRQAVVKAPLEIKNDLNSFASSTPATDGQHVYVAFLAPDGSRDPDPVLDNRFRTPGDIVVSAYDLQGKQVWTQRPGRFASVHGFCSPPILFEDLVLINGDHDGDGYLVALDKNTGEVRWKTQRAHNTRSYCPPLVRELGGRMQMILSGSKTVASYDPRTGKQWWWIDGPTEQFVASPVDNGQWVYITGGYPDKHILAIDPTGNGNVTESHIEWRDTKGCSYVPSPIVVGAYFLIVTDNGIASCFDCQTGERFWMERLRGDHSASLAAAGGLVYFTSDKGRTTIVRPGRQLEVVAENEIGEDCFASPAFSDGQLFLRGVKHLYCIDSASSAH
ncbi:MAG: PQQ-like beta-propeller repeat protein [Planctomycetales bacterium]|nr:PQQ-like beta-propeller repeat protein [Planctomycetales bacterium]